MPKPGASEPDLSEFEELGVPLGGVYRHCWYRRLDPDKRAKVQAAKDAGYSVRQIHQVLNEKWDFKIGRATIDEHFQGKCACPR